MVVGGLRGCSCWWSWRGLVVMLVLLSNCLCVCGMMFGLRLRWLMVFRCLFGWRIEFCGWGLVI